VNHQPEIMMETASILRSDLKEGGGESTLEEEKGGRKKKENERTDFPTEKGERKKTIGERPKGMLEAV